MTQTPEWLTLAIAVISSICVGLAHAQAVLPPSWFDWMPSWLKVLVQKLAAANYGHAKNANEGKGQPADTTTGQ